MKKSNKFLAYAVCILLAVVIACSSLMVGAADATASDSTSYSNLTGADLSYTNPTTTTAKDITDAINDFVEENESLKVTLSELGDDIKDSSEKAEGFLAELIAKIEAALEVIAQYLKLIFRVDLFD